MGLKGSGKQSGQSSASVARGFGFPPAMRPDAAKASRFPYPLLIGAHKFRTDPLKGWKEGRSLKIPWSTGRERHECYPELAKPTNWAEEEAWDVQVAESAALVNNSDWNMWWSIIYGRATTALPPPPAPAADAPLSHTLGSA